MKPLFIITSTVTIAVILGCLTLTPLGNAIDDQNPNPIAESKAHRTEKLNKIYRQMNTSHMRSRRGLLDETINYEDRYNQFMDHLAEMPTAEDMLNYSMEFEETEPFFAEEGVVHAIEAKLENSNIESALVMADGISSLLLRHLVMSDVLAIPLAMHDEQLFIERGLSLLREDEGWASEFLANGLEVLPSSRSKETLQQLPERLQNILRPILATAWATEIFDAQGKEAVGNEIEAIAEFDPDSAIAALGAVLEVMPREEAQKWLAEWEIGDTIVAETLQARLLSNDFVGKEEIK